MFYQKPGQSFGEGITVITVIFLLDFRFGGGVFWFWSLVWFFFSFLMYSEITIRAGRI